jgi:uncharacterized protein YutE (UPF0331/DUF86 family)
MADDVVLNKAATIERCAARVREEYDGDGQELATDQRRQDALVLNLLRACETAIDLAMHAVRIRALGAPQSSRDAFAMLVNAGIVERPLGDTLQRMVGFRNIAVHRYQDLDIDVLHAIVRHQLSDLEAFATEMVRAFT